MESNCIKAPHNYRALGEIADSVLLMTYEWGYTYGPPMAVAPLPNVRAVLDYAVTEIPAENSKSTSSPAKPFRSTVCSTSAASRPWAS